MKLNFTSDARTCAEDGRETDTEDIKWMILLRCNVRYTKESMGLCGKKLLEEKSRKRDERRR